MSQGGVGKGLVSFPLLALLEHCQLAYWLNNANIIVVKESERNYVLPLPQLATHSCMDYNIVTLALLTITSLACEKLCYLHELSKNIPSTNVVILIALEIDCAHQKIVSICR